MLKTIPLQKNVDIALTPKTHMKFTSVKLDGVTIYKARLQL